MVSMCMCVYVCRYKNELRIVDDDDDDDFGPREDHAKRTENKVETEENRKQTNK